MIWAEISFFSKWWNGIDEQKRAMVKRSKSISSPKLLLLLLLLFVDVDAPLLFLLCHWSVC